MATVPRERKKYDSMETKPLASATDEFEDDEEYKSKSDQWLNWALYKLHALLWIIVASALAVYTQLFEVIMDGHPPADPSRKLNRYARASAQISSRHLSRP